MREKKIQKIWALSPAGDNFTTQLTHITLENYYYSIEMKYFGGECSIPLEFSQFLDML
jgi:hypothetical protein